MTGPISWETAQWLIGIILAVVGAAVGTGMMLWRWQSWLAREFQRRDEARQRELAERDKSIEDLRRSLDAHKLFAAEHFATDDSLKQAIEPILRAIERLGDRLDRIIPELPGRRDK